MAEFFQRYANIILGAFGGIAGSTIIAVGLIELITQRLTELSLLLAAFIAGQFDVDNLAYSGIGEVAALLNHVFPLSETLAMGAAYVTLYGLFLTLRWVKSFVPTLAN